MADNPRVLYTPLFDNLVPAVGLIPALVFGLVWRYAHMTDGVCRASVHTLSTRLGMHRLTVMRATRHLVEVGLLKDLTPSRRNYPHVLRPTRLGLALISSVPPAVSLSDSAVQKTRPAVSESDTGCIFVIQRAVSESDMNKTLLRNKERDSECEKHPDDYYREKVDYANQNLLTFYRCRAIVYCRFEAVESNRIVISHPDPHFLAGAGKDFRQLYEKTLAQYLPEGEVNVEFVLREVINP
jgi:hypothetical protein